MTEMNVHVPKARRSGVSDIVATVLIVAATLIAFTAVAGYVFGIFGSSTATANVSISSTSFSASGSSGTLTLANTGTTTVNTLTTNAVTLSYGGKTCSLSISPVVTVVSSSTASFAISYAAAGNPCAGDPATAGQRFTGTVAMGNGESVQLSGAFFS